VNACNSARLWLSVWNDCGHPRDGLANDLRLRTKRKFNKELKNHKLILIQKNTIRIAEDPSKLWKYSKPTKAQSASVSEKKWVEYFTREFSAPNQNTEDLFEKELGLLISNKTKSFLFVSPSSVHSLIPKLKKKSSPGVDYISARHLQLAGSLIEQRSALLFQMILVCGVVPLHFVSDK
jgi:hypothetical protein